jgi:hypothetical protein
LRFTNNKETWKTEDPGKQRKNWEKLSMESMKSIRNRHPEATRHFRG